MKMKTSIPERIAAAVEQLAVQPHEQILEIGCGNGVAAGLVCDKLDGERLVAIDRSETQIGLASRRNHAHVQSGTLMLHTMALESVTLDEAQFDKIFAINVNCFWLRYERPLAAVKRLLKPHGAFFIFYQAPTTAGMCDIASTLRANLHEAGFTITRETTTGPLYCLMSTL
jgi:cyclopropane fatty-acyl-phospholipid synthase-like methyltransferase